MPSTGSSLTSSARTGPGSSAGPGTLGREGGPGREGDGRVVVVVVEAAAGSPSSLPPATSDRTITTATSASTTMTAVPIERSGGGSSARDAGPSVSRSSTGTASRSRAAPQAAQYLAPTPCGAPHARHTASPTPPTLQARLGRWTRALPTPTGPPAIPTGRARSAIPT